MLKNVAVLTPPLIALIQSGLSGSPEAEETSGALTERRWSELLHLGGPHGLLPLLYAGISAVNQTQPEMTSQLLEIYAQRAEDLSQKACHQLEEVLVRCNAEGIEPIVMKGALLATHYYRTPGLRPFGDLDIVVPLDRRDRVAKLLAALGYVAEENYNGFDQAWWTEKHYHWFFRSKQGLPVELHWGLTKPGTSIQFDMEALWTRSRPVSYAGAQARAFAVEDNLLYLAVHASKHHFRIPLRNHVDLAVLLSKAETVDWEAVLQRSRAIGAEMDLAVYLGLGAELGLIVLEQDVERWVRTTTAGKIDFPSLARYALKWPFVVRSNTLIRVLSSSRERRRRWQSLFKHFVHNKPATTTCPPSQNTLVLDKPTVSVDNSVVTPSRIVPRRVRSYSLQQLVKMPALIGEWRHLRDEIMIHRLFDDREFVDEE